MSQWEVQGFPMFRQQHWVKQVHSEPALKEDDLYWRARCNVEGCEWSKSQRQMKLSLDKGRLEKSWSDCLIVLLSAAAASKKRKYIYKEIFFLQLHCIHLLCSAVATGASKGPEICRGQRFFNVNAPLFVFYLLACQVRSEAPHEDEQEVFACIFDCWQYLHFLMSFLQL